MFCIKSLNLFLLFKGLKSKHLFPQVVGADVVFAFHLLELFLLGGEILLLESLRGLVVKHDEITPAHIEAGEMVTSVLGVPDILVHDVCCA